MSDYLNDEDDPAFEDGTDPADEREPLDEEPFEENDEDQEEAEPKAAPVQPRRSTAGLPASFVEEQAAERARLLRDYPTMRV